MTFTEYILNLLENTSSFFDLYIELRLISKTEKEVKGLTIFHPIFNKFINKPKTTNFQEEIKYVEFSSVNPSSTINNLRIFLSTCISPNTRHDMMCKLGRIHVVDSRQMIENKMDIILMIFHYFRDKITLSKKTLFTALFHVIKSARVFPVLSRIADGFNMDSNNKVKLLFNLIAVQNKFVKKQLDKSYYKIEIKNFIMNKIKKMLNKNSSFFPIIYDFVQDYKRYMKTEELNILTKFSDIQDMYMNFVYYTTSEMDLYCLSRIFKNFGQDTENPKFRVIPFGQPKESHNIIVYTGSKHSRIYLDFLNEMKKNGNISNNSGLIRQY